MAGKADTKPKAAPKAKAAGAETPSAKANGLNKPMTPSPELAEVVGKDALSRSDVVSKLWEHIKKNDLQNPSDKREILADDKLEKVFGKKKVTMFEMNKLISPHLS
ncbi:MAG: SWIB/MDM2 domain-containing protein [Sphingomonas sp.]